MKQIKDPIGLAKKGLKFGEKALKKPIPKSIRKKGKKFFGSKWGKALLLVAAVFTGGAALGLWGVAGSLLGGSSAAAAGGAAGSAVATGAASGAAGGVAGAAGAAGASVASGTAAGGAISSGLAAGVGGAATGTSVAAGTGGSALGAAAKGVASVASGAGASNAGTAAADLAGQKALETTGQQALAGEGAASGADLATQTVGQTVGETGAEILAETTGQELAGSAAQKAAQPVAANDVGATSQQAIKQGADGAGQAARQVDKTAIDAAKSQNVPVVESTPDVVNQGGLIGWAQKNKDLLTILGVSALSKGYSGYAQGKAQDEYDRDVRRNLRVGDIDVGGGARATGPLRRQSDGGRVYQKGGGLINSRQRG